MPLPYMRRFYTAYNAGDIETIASVMAEDVVYHDMIYEEPFRGRDEVVAYMKKVFGVASPRPSGPPDNSGVRLRTPSLSYTCIADHPC